MSTIGLDKVFEVEADKYERMGRASLYAKIAAVSEELGPLKKQGKNTRLGFDFVGADEVADKIGALVGKHRLAIRPEITGWRYLNLGSEDGKVLTSSDKKVRNIIVEMVIHVGCGDTGYSESHNWQGKGSTTYELDDKDLSKAVTSGFKYFLIKLFHGSTVEDPDSDQDGDDQNRFHEDPPPTTSKSTTTQPPSSNGASSKPSTTADYVKVKAEEAKKKFSEEMEKIGLTDMDEIRGYLVEAGYFEIRDGSKVAKFVASKLDAIVKAVTELKTQKDLVETSTMEIVDETGPEISLMNEIDEIDLSNQEDDEEESSAFVFEEE